MAKKKKLTPNRLQKLASNPGTRSKLADKYLNPAQLAQRNLNKRLDAPVTPGSSLTNRSLAQQAQNAVKVQYGGQEQGTQAGIAAAQNRVAETGGWFDSYQKDLLAHAQAIQAQNAQANEANKGLAQVAGQVTQFQGAPDAQVAKDAENASAIRQALTASFGAMMNAQGSNAFKYADSQARVVAPGQKLAGLQYASGKVDEARDKLTALKGIEGAADSKYRAKALVDEQNQVIATQALTQKSAAEQAKDLLKAAGLSETARSHKATEKIKAQTVKQKQAADAGKVNQYGYTNKDWAALSTQARQKVIKDFKTSGRKAKPDAPTSGPGSLPPAAEAKIISKINQVYQAISQPKTVQIPYVDANGVRTSRPAKNAQEALAFVRGKAIDPRIIDVARSLLHNNGTAVGQMGVNAAHDLGIHVSPHWKVIKAPNSARERAPGAGH